MSKSKSEGASSSSSSMVTEKWWEVFNVKEEDRFSSAGQRQIWFQLNGGVATSIEWDQKTLGSVVNNPLKNKLRFFPDYPIAKAYLAGATLKSRRGLRGCAWVRGKGMAGASAASGRGRGRGRGWGSAMDEEVLRIHDTYESYCMWEKYFFDPNPSDVNLFNPEEKPVYNNNNNNVNDDSSSLLMIPKVSIGKPYDLMSLFSSSSYKNKRIPLLCRVGGEIALPCSALDGKHILIFCFFLPLLWNDQYVPYIRYIQGICYDLYGGCLGLNNNNNNNNFEVILVPKMRYRFSHNVGLFHKFISAFPDQCLFVPYIDDLLQDSICYSLGLFDKCPKFLMLEGGEGGNNHKVLQFGDALFFQYVGADLFPFTEDKLAAKDVRLHGFTNRFEDIFGYDPSLLRITKVGCSLETGSLSLSLSLSQLNNKVVGLYLCYDGYLMTILADAYKQMCSNYDHNFEIVLVLMCDKFPRETFKEIIMEEVCKRDLTSWWFMPTWDFISRRLLEMDTALRDEDIMTRDRLVVVGSNGQYVDPYAKFVLTSFGADFYPFTREVMVEKLARDLKNLTLEMLLRECFGDCYVDGYGQWRRPEELRNKNAVLYMDSDWLSEDRIVQPLLEKYDEMKNKDPDFVAVFLPMDETALPPPKDLGWIACPYVTDLYERISKHLFFWVCGLIGFGEGGHVCSLKADKWLSSHGLKEFPFTSTRLRADVISVFVDFDQYMGDLQEDGIQSQSG